MKQLSQRGKVMLLLVSLVSFYVVGPLNAQELNGSKNQDKFAAYELIKPWLFERQVISSTSLVPEYLNNLIYANSPYLISHALQPIDWFEWRPDFNKGSGEPNKLLFISIGYSTCHWCHVMAEESFSREDVASILNRDYISVKVDREQWPLIDNRLKSALEAMKGEAGWPINAILTPDGQLVWIDSYLEKQSFVKVISGLARRWHSKPSSVKSLAKRVEQKLLLDKPPVMSENATNLSAKQWGETLPSIQKRIADGLAKEQRSGGPRFFRAYWLLGLMDEYLRQQDIALLVQVQSHVDAILKSPTYDIIEGGFHRYSVDGEWQIPHYEKMLYTQANMVRVLAQLYAITQKERYRYAIMQTVQWTENWLSQDVGFGSAVSALSAGIEGTYYQLTSAERSRINYSSNWLQDDLIYGFSQTRQQRVKPPVDEKVILSWNSLYVVALLEAYQVTNSEPLLTSAKSISQKLWDNFVVGDQIYRSAFADKVAIDAEIEDLAWFAKSQLMLSYYQPFVEYKSDSEPSDKVTDNALYRGHFLLEKLKAQLATPKDLDKVVNLNRDGELPSVRAATFSALNLGYSLSMQRQYRQYAKAVSALSEQWQKRLLNEYSFVAHQANVIDEVNIVQASFARGNGRLSVNRQAEQIKIEFNMAEGWHINAHDTNNDRLIETKLELKLGQAKFQYPQSVNKKLGFNDEVLKLYEGNFVIETVTDKVGTSPNELHITLQACSDKLCLLPERLRLFVH